MIDGLDEIARNTIERLFSEEEFLEEDIPTLIYTLGYLHGENQRLRNAGLSLAAEHAVTKTMLRIAEKNLEKYEGTTDKCE